MISAFIMQPAHLKAAILIAVQQGVRGVLKRSRRIQQRLNGSLDLKRGPIQHRNLRTGDLNSLDYPG